MPYIAREARVVVPRVLLEAFEIDPQKYIKLAWPGLWPVPLEMLRDPGFVEGLIKEFGDGEAYLNINTGR